MVTLNGRRLNIRGLRPSNKCVCVCVCVCVCLVHAEGSKNVLSLPDPSNNAYIIVLSGLTPETLHANLYPRMHYVFIFYTHIYSYNLCSMLQHSQSAIITRHCRFSTKIVAFMILYYGHKISD